MILGGSVFFIHRYSKFWKNLVKGYSVLFNDLEFL